MFSRTVKCPNCGEELELSGAERRAGKFTCVTCNTVVIDPGDASIENTSGQGKGALVPLEIRKWNWGAFFLNWIWGIGNKTYIALLCWIPLIGLIMIFVLGAKGNEWAWRNRRWDSVGHFRTVQHKWAVWGLVYFLAAPTLTLIFLLIIAVGPAIGSIIRTIFF